MFEIMEMSPLILISILMALLFVFLATGLWIGVALALVGFFGLTVLLEGKDVIITGVLYNTLNSYALAAVPLFVFMGLMIYHSGLNKKIYRGVAKWVWPIPGALVHSNIVSCSIFAACCGSSTATCATIGVVAYPEQVEERGYDKRLVLGSIAAGGTLGILIPPSITMVLYGAFVGESVGRLFMGGIVPGFGTALLFMLYIMVRSQMKPSLVPRSRERVTARYFLEAVLALKDIWPAILIFAVIWGSIYSGICTPTEVAAIGAFIVIVLAIIFRALSFKILKEATLETISITAMYGLILVGAKVMGSAFSLLKIPATLATVVLAAEIDPLLVWGLALVMYLIMGCFILGSALMLLTLPVVYPLLVTTLGFDGVWLGVMLVMMVECAAITPPVGMNLYVLQGVTGQKDISDVSIGSFPFFLILVGSMVIWTFFPQAVLALPNMMFAPRW